MTNINGAKIAVLINQVSLLVGVDANRVAMTVDAGGEWLSIYAPEIDTEPFPADVVKFGEDLGFYYFEHDKAGPNDEANYTRFAWLA